MKKRKESSRQKYLVDPSFQLKFIGWIIFALASMIGLFLIAGNHLFNQYASLGKDADLPNNHIFFQFLRDQQEQMILVMGTTGLTAAVVILILGILYSHRVAGPLGRLKKELQRIEKGQEPRPIRVRKKDYFWELTKLYNDSIVKKLRQK